MGWLKNAFAVDPPGPAAPTDAEQAILDKVTREVVRRGLAAPALMFLECCHPLNFIASQLLVFLSPAATLVLDKTSYRVFVAFLERRGSVETLCRCIERRLEEQEDAREVDDA